VDAAGSWSLQPWSAAVLAAALGAYLLGVRQVTDGGEPWPARNAWSWGAGVAVLVVATQRRPAGHDAMSWTAVTGHLLLVTVVPLLLLAGEPLRLLLAASPAVRRDRVAAALGGSAATAITQPGLGVLAYAAVVVGTRTAGFTTAAMRHPWLGAVEPWLFVVAGVLFFLPLVGRGLPTREPLPGQLRAVVLVMAVLADAYAGVVVGHTP
jgi:cytochrome c oxidase assembly factor CtaG